MSFWDSVDARLENRVQLAQEGDHLALFCLR